MRPPRAQVFGGPGNGARPNVGTAAVPSLLRLGTLFSRSAFMTCPELSGVFMLPGLWPAWRMSDSWL